MVKTAKVANGGAPLARLYRVLVGCEAPVMGRREPGDEVWSHELDPGDLKALLADGALIEVGATREVSDDG